MATQNRAFVLLSGGLDSSTALVAAHAAASAEDDVVGVSINYGQRHVKEIDCAHDVCELLEVEHMIVDMAPPPKSMLTDPDAAVPDIAYSDIEGMSPTYVPFRNGQLLSRVAGIAQGWIMDQPLLTVSTTQATVWFGAHAEDAANWAYPDCTPEFIGAMAAAIYVGTYHKVRLIAPFQHMTKGELLYIGAQYGYDYQKLTWSCYKGGELHCGICPTCRARRAAFDEANIEDPTKYLRFK